MTDCHALRKCGTRVIVITGAPRSADRAQNTCLTSSVFSVASCSKPFVFEQEITEATERANREGVFEGGRRTASIPCGSAVHTSQSVNMRPGWNPERRA